jgi:hypothetical protein
MAYGTRPANHSETTPTVRHPGGDRHPGVAFRDDWATVSPLLLHPVFPLDDYRPAYAVPMAIRLNYGTGIPGAPRAAVLACAPRYAENGGGCNQMRPVHSACPIIPSGMIQYRPGKGRARYTLAPSPCLTHSLWTAISAVTVPIHGTDTSWCDPGLARPARTTVRPRHVPGIRFRECRLAPTAVRPIRDPPYAMTERYQPPAPTDPDCARYKQAVIWN